MQILKLGGSVITQKDRPQTADLEAIRRLAKMLGGLWKSGVRDIVLVHGAGSFGHALVIQHRLDNGVKTEAQKLACAQTRAACAKLSAIVAQALLDEGVPAMVLPTGLLAVSTNKRISKFDEKKVLSCLAAGYLPILRGDMVPDASLGFSVCSGDQLVARLGKKAERIVLGSDVDGVLADGKVIPLITSQNFAKYESHLRPSDSPDVTGGMAGKVKELLSVKVSAYVANALQPERLEALLQGKKTICTQIEW
ncbi:Isopentenyl phosphate kinase [uncultured archaeon]|nr:Isopentenyl phosphate kinase [uncultured archaeon]